MWEETYSLILANGLWAVLFCALLIYELRDSQKRERRYTATIEQLLSRQEQLQELASLTATADEHIKDVSADVTQVKRVTGEVLETAVSTNTIVRKILPDGSFSEVL